MQVSTLSKIIIFIFGHQYIFSTEKGEYCLFKCSKHGYQLSRVKGYSLRLECNGCLKDKKILFNSEYLFN